ncbi:Bifunctional inhibitor/plant lipid transfer protein/seed storage helical domain - like 3 [Theobroma cacao]|uniref:Non-specific lipid-transfer protein-like protein At2g13820 isoform X1 n=2 Tax=Theobroma cacao TaxID=3641 RepID=A0AB32VQX5_THECC|nr:PREDICTED: non-specific lipid-transfer protein-like protein At2g13820 isoform X1 [Theobroma cacao]EOX94708.1 Bifunctional inhibitor/lipid-transfer protein/seed storage 2S albumin superfamily protein, putative isoform 1 [Theobroma cacao]WRX08747.1 Bifunctional inhibitor/plant lipid transfer protein/seed storage helical domain - like 3 [Theobroma cacao]
MAARSMKGAMLAAVVIVAATLWTGAVAQSSSSCTNVLVSMSPCLDYIQGNSSKPSSSCCSQLANVVRSQPQCLCEVLNGGASSLGVSVNQTQAMALPTACNVKTPPASQCNASSPADSPSGTSDSPSGGASKTVPTTDDGISTGNSTKLSFSKLFVLLFIAFQASSFITV